MRGEIAGENDQEQKELFLFIRNKKNTTAWFFCQYVENEYVHWQPQPTE